MDTDRISGKSKLADIYWPYQNNTQALISKIAFYQFYEVFFSLTSFCL